MDYACPNSVQVTALNTLIFSPKELKDNFFIAVSC